MTDEPGILEPVLKPVIIITLEPKMKPKIVHIVKTSLKKPPNLYWIIYINIQNNVMFSRYLKRV